MTDEERQEIRKQIAAKEHKDAMFQTFIAALVVAAVVYLLI